MEAEALRRQQVGVDLERGSRHHLGRRDGLFDFRFTDDVGVLVGCGLGGTSLVNAGVVLPAEQVTRVEQALVDAGVSSWRIGRVEPGEGVALR